MGRPENSERRNVDCSQGKRTKTKILQRDIGRCECCNVMDTAPVVCPHSRCINNQILSTLFISSVTNNWYFRQLIDCFHVMNLFIYIISCPMRLLSLLHRGSWKHMHRYSRWKWCVHKVWSLLIVNPVYVAVNLPWIFPEPQWLSTGLPTSG